MSELEFTDRYQALGMPYPDPQTVCRGQCEGTGVVPVYLAKGDLRAKDPMSVRTEDEGDPARVRAWEDAEQENPCSDGWHFVRCPECEGTGKRR